MKIRKQKSKNCVTVTSMAIILAAAGILYSSVLFQKIRYPLKYEAQVLWYSGEFDLEPYIVWALIKAESNFDASAVSIKDAKGLMQISDSTAADGAMVLGISGFKPQDLYKPEINIRLGCWYYRWLLDQFENNASLAVAAYNGGIGNINKWLKDKSISSDGRNLDRIPFEETRIFYERVMKFNEMYSKIYRDRY